MSNPERAGQQGAGLAGAPGLRTSAQWPRLAAGRSDDLSTGGR